MRSRGCQRRASGLFRGLATKLLAGDCYLGSRRRFGLLVLVTLGGLLSIRTPPGPFPVRDNVGRGLLQQREEPLLSLRVHDAPPAAVIIPAREAEVASARCSSPERAMSSAYQRAQCSPEPTRDVRERPEDQDKSREVFVR